MLDASPPECLATGPDGVVNRFNEVASHLFGQSTATLQGQHPWEIFSATGGPVSHEQVLAKLAGTEAPATFEQEFALLEGVRGLAKVSESLIRDSTGSITGIRYALADLTPRVRAAEVL